MVQEGADPASEIAAVKEIVEAELERIASGTPSGTAGGSTAETAPATTG
jgi:hypothetical protein